MCKIWMLILTSRIHTWSLRPMVEKAEQKGWENTKDKAGCRITIDWIGKPIKPRAFKSKKQEAIAAFCICLCMCVYASVLILCATVIRKQTNYTYLFHNLLTSNCYLCVCVHMCVHVHACLCLDHVPLWSKALVLAGVLTITPISQPASQLFFPSFLRLELSTTLIFFLGVFYCYCLSWIWGNRELGLS